PPITALVSAGTLAPSARALKTDCEPVHYSHPKELPRSVWTVGLWTMYGWGRTANRLPILFAIATNERQPRKSRYIREFLRSAFMNSPEFRFLISIRYTNWRLTRKKNVCRG